MLFRSVRASLGRSILQNIAGLESEIEVMTLDPNLEQILQRSVQQAGEGGIEPGMAENLHTALQEHTQRQESLGKPAILLVSAPIRPLVARFVQHSIPGVNVLSYNEVPDDKKIKIIATIG